MEHFKLDDLINRQPSAKPLPRSDPDWVMGRVGLLMSSYRKADYHDPEGFVLTLGTILAQYDPAIVEYVTDPLTGLQRRLKWPPSPAEVVEACTAEIQHREKLARFAAIPAPIARITGPTYSGTQGNGGPGTIYSNYEEAVKKHGRPTGVFEQGREHDYRG